MRTAGAILLLGLAACGGAVRGPGGPSPAVLAADSAARAAIAREQEIDAATLPARTVAVAPFTIAASDTSLHVLGFGLADLLMTDLARSRDITVVDRLRLDALLRELGLARGGAVDSGTAARMGRLAGARRVVTGSLNATGNRARLDGRVGEVATGAIEAARGTETSLDDILDAEKVLAFAVFEALGVTLTPAERARVEQRPTRNLAALLAYSRGVRAQAVLDFQEARRSYQEALRNDPRFGAAGSRLDEVGGSPGTGPGAGEGADLARAGALALSAVNAPQLPQLSTAADPAFRQRFLASILIILNLP